MEIEELSRYSRHLSEIAFKGHLLRLINDEIVTSALCSTDAKLVKTLGFDKLWGIRDHSLNKEEDALMQVGLFEAEEVYGKNNSLKLRLEKFMALKIRDYLGYTFDEYLNLPRHYIEIINESCEKRLRAEAKQNIEDDEKIKNSLAKSGIV